jgi:hypothetical protein
MDFLGPCGLLHKPYAPFTPGTPAGEKSNAPLAIGDTNTANLHLISDSYTGIHSLTFAVALLRIDKRRGPV